MARLVNFINRHPRNASVFADSRRVEDARKADGNILSSSAPACGVNHEFCVKRAGKYFSCVAGSLTRNIQAIRSHLLGGQTVGVRPKTADDWHTTWYPAGKAPGRDGGCFVRFWGRRRAGAEKRRQILKDHARADGC